MEFERIGYRKCSFPFDWLITRQAGVVFDLIENGFQDFLNPEELFQLKDHPSYYRNVKLDIDYYHDFSPLRSFSAQIAEVEEKYNRRIQRFYEEIKKPTLFCRYIRAEDCGYIAENHSRIVSLLKKYNEQNEIIYIANADIKDLDRSLPVYYVEKDENDNVARRFLEKLPALQTFIEENVEQTAQKQKKPVVKKTLAKIVRKICLKLNWVYRHNKQI